MDGRRRRSIKEGFDLGIGFLGFFTAAFFVITLVTEVLRKDALGWALTTLVLALAVTALWFGRRAALRRFDERAAVNQDRDA
jgi:membrane protein implicated in regulation of membrane protease activity